MYFLFDGIVYENVHEYLKCIWLIIANKELSGRDFSGSLGAYLHPRDRLPWQSIKPLLIAALIGRDVTRVRPLATTRREKF